MHGAARAVELEVWAGSCCADGRDSAGGTQCSSGRNRSRSSPCARALLAYCALLNPAWRREECSVAVCRGLGARGAVQP